MEQFRKPSEQERKKVKGASLVEYMLLLLLVAVIAVAAVRSMGAKTSQRWSEINSAV
jgi:Flp pilus assembly pilin Flp